MILDLHGPELLGEQVSLEVRGSKGQRLRTGWLALGCRSWSWAGERVAGLVAGRERPSCCDVGTSHTVITSITTSAVSRQR